MFLRIRDMREDCDYSQSYVSKLLKCSRSNYAMYESGSIKINIEQLVKLADIYNASLDYLLGLTDAKRTKTKIYTVEKQKLQNNVKILRLERNLHQSFLASQVLNCTQSAYSQYETGKRKINIDALVTLAKFYNVSVDFLVGRTKVTE